MENNDFISEIEKKPAVFHDEWETNIKEEDNMLEHQVGDLNNDSDADKSIQQEYSPPDDSDNDPDFDPENPEPSAKRPLHKFFKDEDLNGLPLQDKENIENNKSKKIKLINYKAGGEILPSPEIWETQGLRDAPVYMELALSNWNENIQNTDNNLNVLHKTPDSTETPELQKKVREKKNKKVKKINNLLMSPCKKKCRKKCFEKISENRRQNIFEHFNNLDFSNRQMFLEKCVERNVVKYRKVDAENNKQFTVSYRLPFIPENTEDASSKSTTQRSMLVCKPMFLHTLGFKTDGIITSFLRRTSNDLPDLKDNRGKVHAKKMKEIAEENYSEIKKHIESYHPQVSHYNLAHAPHRRYLPSDVTIHQMHKDFGSKHKKSVSYETYRKVFDKENIGFTTPSQDECGLCSIYKNHAHSQEGSSLEQNEKLCSTNGLCSTCDKYKIHKQRYTIARQMYNQDTSKENCDDTEFYAVDMQKVLLLPKMTIKNSFFVSRLVVLHETFANLKPKGLNKCILWHEAIMGRKAADVTSAYYNALIKLNTETKHVIFWADNCCSQNKNWVLFTACLTFVNEDWGPETITFKYFEPGHSFMKADSLHGQIGKKWKKLKEILDFEDLEQLIKTTNKLNIVTTLRAEDFRLFENGCTQRKKDSSSMPKLSDIKSVQFRKGSRKLFFKEELEDDDFKEASVLKPKFKLELPNKATLGRGINTKKKETILKELLPYMPPRKQIFWQELPNSDENEDLGKLITEI